MATLAGDFYGESVAFTISPVDSSEDMMHVSCTSGVETIATHGYLSRYVGHVELLDLYDALNNARALKGQYLPVSPAVAGRLHPQYVVRYVDFDFLRLYLCDHAAAKGAFITMTIFVYRESAESERLWECHAMIVALESCETFARQLISEVETAWPNYFLAPGEES